MSIQFRCSHCSSRIEAPDAASGKKAKCPTCGSVIEVPIVKPDEDPLAGFDEFMAGYGARQTPLHGAAPRPQSSAPESNPDVVPHIVTHDGTGSRYSRQRRAKRTQSQTLVIVLALYSSWPSAS